MPSHLPHLDPERLNVATKRILKRCDELAGLSEDSEQLTRTFCCEPMLRVHARLTHWMQAAEMSCRVDALGNLIGSRRARPDIRKAFMIGSHLDTVVNAGKYDGTLGVLLGLGVAELLLEANISLPFALDVVGFSEEEGVRFQTPFLGSRAIAGEFQSELLEIQDQEGNTVRAALESFGVDPSQWPEAAYASEDLIGFLEPHIEQGPVLDQLKLPVGIVTAIAGQTRATFSLVGQAGHAGTVPPMHRKDALAAAAELISAIEGLAQKIPGSFATVGNIRVQPNVSNVIAGRVDLRLDLRHENDEVRLHAYNQIQQVAADIAKRRKIEWSILTCEQQSAVPMDAQLTKTLRQSLTERRQKDQLLVSGAGHDAVMMARRTPTCMLFLRCHAGISHHPNEHVNEQAVQVALEVMVDLVARLGTASS